MFYWWSEQSPWLRFGGAALFLGISTVLWFCGKFWPYGWAIGTVLLILSFPSDAEKKGYRN